jgi:hypothetical protein
VTKCCRDTALREQHTQQPQPKPTHMTCAVGKHNTMTTNTACAAAPQTVTRSGHSQAPTPKPCTSHPSRPLHSVTAAVQQAQRQQPSGARHTHRSLSGPLLPQVPRQRASGVTCQQIWLLLRCGCLCLHTSCCGRRTSAGLSLAEQSTGKDRSFMSPRQC